MCVSSSLAYVINWISLGLAQSYRIKWRLLHEIFTFLLYLISFQNDLNKHLLVEHCILLQDGEQVFVCHFCPQTFTHQSLLNSHLSEKHKNQVFYFSFFALWSWSAYNSFYTIYVHVAGFYKPTVSQSPPSHLQDYSICNNVRLEFSTNFPQILFQV